MRRVRLQDVIQAQGETWAEHDYTLYNQCGKCKGKLKTVTQVGDTQTLKCIKCYRMWKLDIKTDVITLA